MTLLEMSVQYADSAAAIRGRIVDLRAAEREQADAEAAGCCGCASTPCSPSGGSSGNWRH